jgi:hypothetical protein
MFRVIRMDPWQVVANPKPHYPPWLSSLLPR